MDEVKILFRADGNSKIGLGHLYRLFSLVEIVKASYNYLFLTQEESSFSVIPNSYNKKTIPKLIDIENEPDWLEDNFSAKDHLIIFDGYQFDSSYQRKVKEKGFKSIFIDDLAKEHMFADIVINHSPSLKAKDFRNESYTKLALGTKYALLRPLFLESAKENRVFNRIDTVFVCFGGADPLDLSLLSAKALLRISAIKKINIVLGAAYSFKEIFELESSYPDKLKIYRNLSEKKILCVMKKCNFAIAPSSTILYELCCVKMIILSGYYVENQKHIYSGFLKKKLIVGGGDFRKYSDLDFEEKIKFILNNSSQIESQTKNQKKFFSGKNKLNLIGLINSLNISSRRANLSDLERVFNWSNDKLARAYSYNSETIKFEEHKRWFVNKIQSKNTLFLIILVNRKPAGIVRFEIENENSVIGILVSKEFRGQNLSSKFLNEGIRTYFRQFNGPILAYIKKENIASKKAFEKANFEHLKNDVINGFESHIYIRK